MTDREKFIEILAKVTECPANIIEAYLFNIDHVLQAMQSAAEARTEELRPYLDHAAGCDKHSFKPMAERKCTCNLSELLK